MWAKIAQFMVKDILPIVIQGLVDKFSHNQSTGVPAPAVGIAPTVVK